MNAIHFAKKTTLLLASAVTLSACGNLKLMTQGPKTETDVYTFQRPATATTLNYTPAKADGFVTEQEVRSAITESFKLSNKKRGYSQSWNEYYGSGSWVLSSNDGIALDFRNKINHGVTHVTTSYKLAITQHNNGISAELTPDNRFAKTEGFNLFGEVTPLMPYDQLEFKSLQVYEKMEWLALPRTATHSGELISGFPAKSLKANFDRLLKPLPKTTQAPFSVSADDNLYRIVMGDTSRIVAMQFYPYRNGSKASYKLVQAYQLNADGSNSYDASLAKRLKNTLSRIAAD